MEMSLLFVLNGLWKGLQKQLNTRISDLLSTLAEVIENTYKMSIRVCLTMTCI